MSVGELDLLAEARAARALAGLDAARALALCTRDAARALGLDAGIGSLRVGKWGDCTVIRLPPDGGATSTGRVGAVQQPAGRGGYLCRRTGRVSQQPTAVKIQRHAAILRVVRERRIESQDELREVLATEGFTVTQATLSRDIRELGLAKLADPQGGAFYTHPHRAAVRPDLAQVLPTLLVSVDGVGPLLVLKTASGSAGAITEALDQAGWAEIIGTIAGDDTVLVITRSQRVRETVAQRIQALVKK